MSQPANKMPALAYELGQTGHRNGRTLALTMPPLDKPGLGRRLRVARETAGLSQEALGELLEVDRKTIGHYEAGKHLTLDAVQRISEATGHDFAWLVTGDERMVDRTVLHDILRRLEAIEAKLGL